MRMYCTPSTSDAAATDACRLSRRRRRKSKGRVSNSLPLIYALSLVSVWCSVDGFCSSFMPTSFGYRHQHANGSWAPTPSSCIVSSRRQTVRYADRSDQNGAGQEMATWSKQATPKSGSRFQVRKRVKAVLEKARTRTGIDNMSDQNPSSVIADAATLGGLGDGSADFVVQLSQDFPIPKRNGVERRQSTSSSSSTSFPDEVLVWQKQQDEAEARNGKASNTSNADSKSPELDAIQADVPAAAKFCEPLPFKLPKLSQEQIEQLQAGERIQEQSRMGREGSGYVVLDVKAPPYVVWECLLDFETYPETIPTVRDMQLFTNKKLNYGYVNEKPVLPGTGRETRHYGTPSVTRAKFTLSKFRLNIAAIHRYTPHPEGDYMIFTLDPSCTNMVLKGATGTWYTKANPEGREGWTRVFLLCEVKISRALPSFIVDYAADRAMPRATTWLRPQVEAAADLWLRRPSQGQ